MQTPDGPPTVKSLKKSSPEENSASQPAATEPRGRRKSHQEFSRYPNWSVVSAKVTGGGKRKCPFGGDEEDVKEKKITQCRKLAYPGSPHGGGAKATNYAVRTLPDSSNLADGGPDVLSGDASKKHDHKEDENQCSDTKRLLSILDYFGLDGDRALTKESYRATWARCTSIYLTHVQSFKSVDKDKEEIIQLLVVLYLALISVDKKGQTNETTRLQKKTFHEIKKSMRHFDWEGDNIGGAMSHLIVSFTLLRSKTFSKLMIETARGREVSMGSVKVEKICDRIEKELRSMYRLGPSWGC